MAIRGKAGRRERQANLADARTKRVYVRVSKKDLDDLTVRAQSAGQSVPRLMVERALVDDSGVTRTDHEYMKFLINGLSNEINKVGVNLNQIAHATNAENSIPNELRGPLAEMIIELKQLARRGRGIYDHMQKD